METEDDADVESVNQEADQEEYESGQEEPGKLQVYTEYNGSNQEAKSPQNEGYVTKDDENFNWLWFSMKDSLHHYRVEKYHDDG